MLRLYFDEDVDVLAARLLTARGFDCLTAVEASQLAQPDAAHLEFATNDRRVLITHNRTDFEQLAREYWVNDRDHAGVVLAIRRANTYELTRRLLAVLSIYGQDEWRNCVLYA